jgi:AP2 domain
MKEIKLNKGYVALVDDEDYERLSKLNWRVSIHKRKRRVYAVATVKLHRLALDVGNADPDVDHKNGDGLDCQKANLRLCTDGQNSANVGPNRNSRSGFKGVYFHKASGKWASCITRGGRRTMRYFDNPLRAAVEYDVMSRALDGEFARPNFQLCPLC